MRIIKEDYDYEIIKKKWITMPLYYFRDYGENDYVEDGPHYSHFECRCPKCRNITRITKEFEGPRYLAEQEILKNAKCDYCGEVFDMKTGRYLSGKGEYMPQRLLLLRTSKGVTIKLYSRKILPAKNAKRWPWFDDQTTHSFTFLKNGMTIQTLASRSDKNESSKSFHNVTYSSIEDIEYLFSSVPEAVEKEFKFLLKEELENMIGRSLDGIHLHRYAYVNNMHNLPVAFYEHCVNPNDFDWMNNDPEDYYIPCNSYIRNLYKHMKKENWKYLTHVKGKKMRKLIMQDPMRLVLYKVLVCEGLKDPNFIRKIIESVSFSDFYGRNYKKGAYQEIKDFFNLYAPKLNTEKLFTNLVLSKSRCFLLLDITRLMKTIKESNQEDVKKLLDKKKLNTTSAQELHDYLSETLYEIKNKKVIYSYPEEIKQLENEEFVLPKDSYELQSLGRNFHNCVGGYHHRILDGSSIIFCRKNAGDDVCIEIRPNDNRYMLVQAKQAANKFMSESQFNSVVKWCKDSKIDYRNCRDIDLLMNNGKFNSEISGQYAY